MLHRTASTFEGKLRITIEGQRVLVEIGDETYFIEATAPVPIDLNHRCDDDLLALAWATLAAVPLAEKMAGHQMPDKIRDALMQVTQWVRGVPSK